MSGDPKVLECWITWSRPAGSLTAIPLAHPTRADAAEFMKRSTSVIAGPMRIWGVEGDGWTRDECDDG